MGISAKQKRRQELMQSPAISIAAQKLSAGRPKLPDSERRGPRVVVYLRPIEIDLLDALASSEGLSRSDYLRSRIVDQGTRCGSCDELLARVPLGDWDCPICGAEW